MESDTDDPERQAFEILELIDAVRNAPWCQSSVCRGQNIEQLLDDLEDSYRVAMEPWAVHRTTPGELFQEDFYRWHEDMFPADVYQEACWRFNELVTTSRFSVEETPCLHDLEQVNSTNDKITHRHIVSLAVLACIRFALDDLESIKFLDAQEDIERISGQIEQSRDVQKQADLWLSQLATLSVAQHQTIFEGKKQPREASKKLRNSLTCEVVVSFFKERPGQKVEAVICDLREKLKIDDKYTVSERTIARRYSDAKKKNLLP